jgi:hypothetical protein
MAVEKLVQYPSQQMCAHALTPNIAVALQKDPADSSKCAKRGGAKHFSSTVYMLQQIDMAFFKPSSEFPSIPQHGPF